ncbi:MAG TPA: MBL fold hydrolase [Bacteroidales bacterium]|nr:MBL fold hydrolase [Bacteroidales bacterium]
MEIRKLVFNPISVNTYVLSDGSGDCAIIDCGCYDSFESEELTALLEDGNLKPVLLLNTHCHLDHIFGDRLMLEKYGLGALCHHDDLMNRKRAVDHARMFGLSMEHPPEPAGYLSGGEKVRFGNSELEVIHVPGHAPGSLAFYSKPDKSVFTGDALFEGSIGRTDLPGGNHETLLNSIRDRLFILPADTVVYPGHGNSTLIGDELRFNPYFIHK